MPNRTLAVALRLLTWVAAALVVLIPTYAWIGPGDGALAGRSPPLASLLDGSGWHDRLAVLALIFPPYLCVGWGLIQLSSFCGRLAKGEHFSKAASTAVRRFGWSLVALFFAMAVIVLQ